ncbi:dynein heavy chain, N-terminal region 2-domain-containing protein [Phakopsora pachyrhizi]|nr:dynein heavy chain, N-terminal region 2-domain-containing protein [Phakopsora pachyrhizi]
MANAKYDMWHKDVLAGSQMKIVAEDKVVRSKIETLLTKQDSPYPWMGQSVQQAQKQFNNINAEYLSQMKPVFKSPYVIDLHQIPEALKTLDKPVESLSKLQEALGKYHEHERSSFPPFYFVGDGYLLEILGNSKEIFLMLKHLKKMFTGLSTLTIDQDLTRIENMCYREGEEIPF